MSLSQRLPEIRAGFDRPFWVANISEIFERLSYYGAFSSLALYLHEKLNFSTEQTGTLAGIFGRKIASLPGYNFSEALKQLNIVWTPETVSKLFEVGPMTYTPGTKMPEQRIGSAEDRAALMKFLDKTTTSHGGRVQK